MPPLLEPSVKGRDALSSLLLAARRLLAAPPRPPAACTRRVAALHLAAPLCFTVIEPGALRRATLGYIRAECRANCAVMFSSADCYVIGTRCAPPPLTLCLPRLLVPVTPPRPPARSTWPPWLRRAEGGEEKLLAVRGQVCRRGDGSRDPANLMVLEISLAGYSFITGSITERIRRY